AKKPAEEPAQPAPVSADSPDGGAENVAPASSEAVKTGRDAIQEGDFERAEKVLREASEADPKDPQAAFYLGVALEGTGDLAQAAEEYRRAVELSPELMEARANLSYLLLTEDKAEEALSVAEGGLKLDPENVPLLANRALA